MFRFVRVEQLKEQLLENNKQTYWVPDYVKVRWLSPLPIHILLIVTCTNELNWSGIVILITWAWILA